MDLLGRQPPRESDIAAVEDGLRQFEVQQGLAIELTYLFLARRREFHLPLCFLARHL